MSDSQEQPWSDNPNAPMIPLITYHNEKAWFAGTLASFILYGTPQRSPPTRLPISAHDSVCSVYSRDSHYTVLQLHDRAV